MYILELHQAERVHPVGLFNNEEDVKSWLNSIHLITKEIDIIGGTEYEYYSLPYEKLKLYEEIKWKDSRFPLTKYMFAPDNGTIEAVWYELPLMNTQSGLVSGTTQVDAYMVNNDEVESYISTREIIKSFLLDYFKSKNINAALGGLGSEDGEYIYSDTEGIIHIDSSLVDIWNQRTSDEAFLEEVIQPKF